MELISVVTISFNQAAHLRAALDSVHRPPLPGLEHIVVDPGSSDDSRAILDSYPAPLHKLYDKDRGPADGLNKGFAAARGSICYFLNADDLVCPGALPYARDFFDRHPDVDVLYGGGFIADEHGRLLKFIRPTYFSCSTYLHDATNLQQQAFFFRRSAFDKVGGFNLDNRVSWDGELFFEMKRAGLRFHAVYAALGNFRVYPSTITSSQGHAERRQAVRDRLWKRHFGRPKTPLDSCWRAAWRVAKQVSAVLIWLRTMATERSALRAAGTQQPPLRSTLTRWLPSPGKDTP